MAAPNVIQALRARLGAPYTVRWLALYVAARLTAWAIAFALTAWSGIDQVDAVLLLYGPLSTAVLAASPALRRSPVAWAIDVTATLALVVDSGDWRSPYYLLWLVALALPAAYLPLRHAAWLALGAPVAFLFVAIWGGPAPGHLAVSSTETLAIHLSLPTLLVGGLAYVCDTLRRLSEERSQRERLAIEAERRRIAWELHDSAKQRLHAAHLLVSSLSGRVGEPLERVVARATVELESAASDMDSSLAELRSPLEGRRLDEALRERAGELSAADEHPTITVTGRAPVLPPLIAAHVYRIGSEAITNALRHADAETIAVDIHADAHRLRLRIADDGRGLPAERRPGANGLFAIESRAATIGATVTFSAADGERGTAIELLVPLHQNGAPT
ncbi:histidine kinase [Solirubrobacter ginsenosidimutans]|uniref:Histidine kinase n=1 Tax=Solirubrobacter ginsenosidimutans TaxID=490573 RepID=A0A9X3N0E6_9ACTN|nr:ATP-binding protein [Solirubrobacter ginsenosidimutans]MDA0164482.1 histidine kinase [Solirubrobacter ginsenosidimutans]